MLRPDQPIRHRCQPRPIKKSLVASILHVFLVTVCVVGLFKVSVNGARITTDKGSTLFPKKYAQSSKGRVFNCPSGWSAHRDRCYRLVQTQLAWDEARHLCESYDGVLAELYSNTDWSWLKDIIHSQVTDSNAELLEKDAVVDNPNPRTQRYTRLWAGIQRLRNGTFVWTDGLPSLVVQNRVWEGQGSIYERQCVEMSILMSRKETPEWRLSACDNTNMFVCQLEACPRPMVRCPRESRCVPIQWICDGRIDCQSGWDEHMCTDYANRTGSQTTFCGATFKADQGSLESPNYPGTYPPLSHCSWTVEANPDKVLLFTVHNVDLEAGHDYLRIYDGVKLTTGSLVKDISNTNASRTVIMNGSVATVQFLSDITNQRTGFSITWTSVHSKENVLCGDRVLVSDKMTPFDFKASNSRISKMSTKQFHVCDWVLTPETRNGMISVQIVGLTLDVDESMELFDGPSNNNDIPVISYHKTLNDSYVIAVHSTLQDHQQFMSTYVSPTPSFIPTAIVALENIVRIRVRLKGRSNSHLRFFHSLGCHHTISITPVMILSPGFSMSRYPNSVHCTWDIKHTSEDSKAEITALWLPGFHTEEEKDFVEINDQHDSGNKSPHDLPQHLSGHIRESTVMSFTSNFVMQFTSDSTVNKGQWVVVISKDHCKPPNLSDGLTALVTKTTLGSQVIFSCQNGHTLSGHNTSFCGVFGNWWPHELPTCSVTSCTSPPIPRDGYLSSLTGLTFGSGATFQCHNGYRLHGNPNITCGSHGWSQLPVCREIWCPKVPPPDNGRARADDLRFGALREYFCKPSHRLVGSKFSHCNASGLWTDDVPSCEPRSCPRPPRLLNGKFDVSGPVVVDQEIQAICENGFALEGPEFITCQADLSFGPQLPNCVDIDECSATDRPCGDHYCQNSHGEYHCMCAAGYKHTNAQTTNECTDIDECAGGKSGCSHQCDNTPGSYTCSCPHPYVLHTDEDGRVGNRTLFSSHTCIAYCPPLVAPVNGHIVYRSHPLHNGHYLDGTQAIVMCTHTLPLMGERVLTCTVDSLWTHEVGYCQAQKCDDPPSIVNGVVVYENVTHGSPAIYKCDVGFTLKGPSHRFCLPKVVNDVHNQTTIFTWSGSTPYCQIVSCPPLYDPKNGRVVVSSSSFQAVAVYQCECGYKSFGSTVVECTSRGKWSHPPPICEVQTCDHPAVPQNTVMSNVIPGFPVWSAIKYSCSKQGYRMSGPSIIVCQPKKTARISNASPLLSLNIRSDFIITSNNSDNTTDSVAECLSGTKNPSSSFAKRVEAIVYKSIRSHCGGMNISVVLMATEEEVHVDGKVSYHTNVSLASYKTASTQDCALRISSPPSILLNEMELIWTDVLGASSPMCRQILETVTRTGVVSVGNWHCVDGLTLEHDKDRSVCVEGCLETTKTIHSVIQSMENSQHKGHDPSYQALDAVNPHDNHDFGQFQYPVHDLDELTPVETESTTILPITKSSQLNAMSTTITGPPQNTVYHDDIFHNSLMRSLPLRTESSTEAPFPHVTTTSAIQPAIVTTTATPTPTRKRLPFVNGVLLASDFGGGDTSGFGTTPSNKIDNNPFGLDLNKDREYFTADDNIDGFLTRSGLVDGNVDSFPTNSGLTGGNFGGFPTRTDLINDNIDGFSMRTRPTVDDLFEFPTEPGQTGERDETLWTERLKSRNNSNNCSADFGLQTQMHNAANSKASQSSPLSSANNGATMDDGCKGNQMLEKQETKLVHAATTPSFNLSSPFYTIEVRDTLTGSFSNISCVDAVHMLVNAKVNEILQQFGQLMEHSMCQEVKGANLELVGGNIRFKGSTARVYIKFAITHTPSSHAKSYVVDCGQEFESYVRVQLPKVLSLLLPVMLKVNCAYVNYTASDFRVSHTGWACRRGYILHPSEIRCKPTPHNQGDVVDKKQPVDFVKSLPRLRVTFNGVFNVLGKQRPTRSMCAQEYESGISDALTKIEPHLQKRFFQCANLYLQPSKNVSVLHTGTRIIAKASIDLVPLTPSVDIAAMTKCSRFLSLHFREPSQLLSTVTLGQSYLPTCPAIRLMPHGIRANQHFIYYCPTGFHYESENFRCIHELIPMYSSAWTLRLEGPMDDHLCQGAVQQAAPQLIRSVQTEIRQRIHYKHICNGTTGVILIPKEGIFDITDSKISLKVTVSIASLNGGKDDVMVCMSDIHKRINAMVTGPKTALIQKVVQLCQSDLFTISRLPILAYTRWECRHHFTYNSLTGSCESFVSPEDRFKGLKTSRLVRSTRSDPNDPSSMESLSPPAWSGAPPSCIDVTPPIFHACPDREVVVVLGQIGPKYLSIPLPVAIDNSGQAPRMAYDPPDFAMPYRFSQDMNLVMIANDSVGNTALCNITIVVIDNIPPVLTCPTEVVKVPAPSSQTPHNISIVKQLPEGVARAWDNSDHVTITYDVLNVVAGSTSGDIVVRAIAQDDSSNTATCSFFVKLVDESCSVSNLPTPANGYKKCVKTGGHPGGLACSISCESNKSFAVKPPPQYICANDQTRWIPTNTVPDCFDTHVPDFEMSYTFNISFRDNGIPECVTSAGLSVKSSIETIFRPQCGAPSMQHLNFTVHISNLVYQYSSSSMISSTIKVFIHTKNKTTVQQSPLAVICGSQSIPEVGEWINTNLRRHCLGQDIAPVFGRPLKNITCVPGRALVNAMCVECPAGTYWSNLECAECPVGSYQTRSGRSGCDLCPSGTSTRNKGATSDDQCYAICQHGSYSPDGLQPCLPCPVGMYQHLKGATWCNDCIDENSTSLIHCQDACRPGTYSLSGEKPCYRCPVNTYSTKHGMKHCVACPDGFITQEDGADSLDLCLEYDPCQTNPCLHNGECIRTGHQFVCICNKNYTGATCENIPNPCHSGPCSNGGICQQDDHNYNCSCDDGYAGTHCETFIDHCFPEACVHGMCINNGTQYTCECSPGFEGFRCDIDKDDCLVDSCHNGGQCQDLVNGFQCFCERGYQGSRCEINTDDCVSAVCLNHGACVDGVDSYTCTCPNGFSGMHCETAKNSCESSPCQNGGICEANENGYHTCLCPMGFHGNNCEDKVDVCWPNPCWNNGTCSNIHTSSLPMFSCSCPQGFTGKLCHKQIDHCSPEPCNSNGTDRCENDPMSHLCVCRPGWTGAVCDVQLDPCNSNPCLNHGTCLNHDGHLISCICASGYTGSYCDELIDTCHPNPCINKGHCVVDKLGKQPTCSCREGFAGAFCEDNIDDCVSSPCQNGGKCVDGVNGFVCRCAKGYAGLTCDVVLDLCLGRPCTGRKVCQHDKDAFSCVCPEGTKGTDCDIKQAVPACHPNPCQNGGQCIEKGDNFHCGCPDGFSGTTCADRMRQDCDTETFNCLNGGTCVLTIRYSDEDDDEDRSIDDFGNNSTPVCICPPGFEGTVCENEKTPSYDLQFSGPHQVCNLGHINTTGKLGLTFCIWIQITSGKNSDGSIIITMIDNGNSTVIHIRINGKRIKISQKSGQEFDVDSIGIGDGLWHQVCVLMGGGLWKVYQDGRMIHSQLSKDGCHFDSAEGLEINLCTSDSDETVGFTSAVTALSIYGGILNDDEIQQLMKGNIYNKVMPDLFNWKDARECGGAGIELIEPSSHVFDSIKGLHSTSNKKPPIVSFCPKHIRVVTEQSPVPVSWKDPVFDSVSDIVSIEQKFHSGQVFPYGHHTMSYTASDAMGNVASCSFHISISRYRCIDPPPPANGARVCGEWRHGRYCIPSCLPYYSFVSPVPPFYVCGNDGSWNPATGHQPFTFPLCARAVSPILFLIGLLEFQGPACDAEFVQQLESHMTTILAQVDLAVGLCGDKKTCNYSQSLHSECGDRTMEVGDVGGARIKRDAVDNGGKTGFYVVQLNITFPSEGRSSETAREGKEWLDVELALSIKNSPELEQYDLTSVNFNMENRCVSGTVEMKDVSGHVKCVECPADHEITEQSVCRLCPVGWYNDRPGKQACKNCSQDPATPTSQNCKEVCEKGAYLHPVLRRCILCPRGQYQDETGMVHCKSCAVGYSTVETGSQKLEDCLDICRDGEELGPHNDCVLCPIGFYKNRTMSPHCVPCPYAWTTIRTGAVDLSDCVNRKCTPGHFLDVHNGSCLPCPKGTFQASVSVTPHCQPCGVGQTTVDVGAHNPSLCIPGHVDECALGIHDCPTGYTTCDDVKEGLYVCRCNFGVQENGLCKKEEKETNRCHPALSSDELQTSQSSSLSDPCGCDGVGCDMSNFENDSKTFLESLALYILTITTTMTCLLFLIIIIVVCRRRTWRARSKHQVRLYRREVEKSPPSFQNNGFDSGPVPISTISHHAMDTSSSISSSSRSCPSDSLAIRCYTDSLLGFRLNDTSSNIDFS